MAKGKLDLLLDGLGIKLVPVHRRRAPAESHARGTMQEIRGRYGDGHLVFVLRCIRQTRNNRDENWFDLLPGPAQVNRVLDALDGKVGLNGDFGNWKGVDKYDDLAKIMGRAELCHAKGNYSVAGLDVEDYARCVRLSNAAGYQGPFTLIYDSTYHQDEWAGLLEERDCIANVFKEMVL